MITGKAADAVEASDACSPRSHRGTWRQHVHRTWTVRNKGSLQGMSRPPGRDATNDRPARARGGPADGGWVRSTGP